jgi:hypothetical protein
MLHLITLFTSRYGCCFNGVMVSSGVIKVQERFKGPGAFSGMMIWRCIGPLFNFWLVFIKECEFRFNYGSPKQQMIILKKRASL